MQTFNHSSKIIWYLFFVISGLSGLGMANIFWTNTRYLPYPYSHGYSSLTGSLVDVTNWSPSLANAAGILISNIFDLKIWDREITEGKLLSDNMKSERFKWGEGSTPGISYYGFGIEKVVSWIGHSGLIQGYNTEIYCNPVNKMPIIVSANSENGSPAKEAFVEFAGIMVPWGI